MDKCPASDVKKYKKMRISLKTILFCFSHILLVWEAARDMLSYLWVAKDNMKSFSRKEGSGRRWSDGKDEQHHVFNQQQISTKYLYRYLTTLVSPLKQLYLFHPATHNTLIIRNHFTACSIVFSETLGRNSEHPLLAGHFYFKTRRWQLLYFFM